MTTGDNDKFLRQWTETDISRIAFDKTDVSQIDLSITPWIPYHKGGEQRKWYGNHEYVVNWSASGQFNRAKTTMTHVYLKPCIRGLTYLAILLQDDIVSVDLCLM